MRLKPIILIGFLSSCAEFPALEGSVTPDMARSPFPTLVSLDPILAQAGALDSSGLSAAVPAATLSRAETLRARAARLRGPVVDAATRARMRAGIDTSALR